MLYPLSYQFYRKRAVAEFIGSRVLHSFRKQILHTSCIPTIGNAYYVDFLHAIEDCCDFLHIDLKTFNEYFENHHLWAQQLWKESKGDANYFNETLAQKYADKNIAANCVYSFSLKYSYDTLYYYLNRLTAANKSVTLCDFGCANAHLSFAMLHRQLITHLELCDLPGMVEDFIKFRNLKYGLNSITWQDAAHFTVKEKYFDAVICFDVLEHLPNPSKVLSTVLYPILKPGGYLFMQAPWGGGVPSHLDEAIIDFYGNGGKEFLSQNFRKINTMAAMDISGVWKKK
jgi:2-polyprenyl-3-methyl-5-hydroxy-6-metoxy-1,4-benzoquinol methylase